jgi:hypothetical protein
MLEITWVVEHLLASHEGLSSMDFVTSQDETEQPPKSCKFVCSSIYFYSESWQCPKTKSVIMIPDHNRNSLDHVCVLAGISKLFTDFKRFNKLGVVVEPDFRKTVTTDLQDPFWYCSAMQACIFLRGVFPLTSSDRLVLETSILIQLIKKVPLFKENLNCGILIQFTNPQCVHAKLIFISSH